MRLHNQLFGWQIQKEGRALCFTAGLLCTITKGKEYSENPLYDTEVILVHYRVDKTSISCSNFIGSTSNELTSINLTKCCHHFCCLIASSYNLRTFGP